MAKTQPSAVARHVAAATWHGPVQAVYRDTHAPERGPEVPMQRLSCRRQMLEDEARRILEVAMSEDEVGHCDECDATYDVGDQTDHCAVEGLCWMHCSSPARHEPREEASA